MSKFQRIVRGEALLKTLRFEHHKQEVQALPAGRFHLTPETARDLLEQSRQWRRQAQLRKMYRETQDEMAAVRRMLDVIAQGK